MIYPVAAPFIVVRSCIRVGPELVELVEGGQKLVVPGDDARRIVDRSIAAPDQPSGNIRSGFIVGRGNCLRQISPVCIRVRTKTEKKNQIGRAVGNRSRAD